MLASFVFSFSICLALLQLLGVSFYYLLGAILQMLGTSQNFQQPDPLKSHIL